MKIFITDFLDYNLEKAKKFGVEPAAEANIYYMTIPGYQSKNAVHTDIANEFARAPQKETVPGYDVVLI